MKKIFICAGLLLLSCRITTSCPAEDVVPVNNSDYGAVLEREIALTRKNIYIIHYSFYDSGTPGKLIKLLKDASIKGVDVKILLDDNSRHSKSFVKKYSSYFKIKLDSPEKTTHCKLIIFDSNRVLIGSTNLSDNSIRNNNETNVLIYSQDTANYFTDYFKEMWRKSDEDITIGKNGSASIEPLADRDIYPALISLISATKDRLYVCAYIVNSDHEKPDDKTKSILDEIIKAKNRGAEIKFIMEKNDMDDYVNAINKNTFAYLKKNGIDVRFDNPETITHAKLLISDNKVMLGSANWGYGGLNLYHESGVIINIPEVTAGYAVYFNELWENSK
ncbi:phospholipase D-like domain-containing protein [bacterium]|jgi:phosphatidylserine/phosphatidylglycerophosphate/cardiolipin synthase-like enzyme|nr:phospholipase D-like domain-containing protein [bacterium]